MKARPYERAELWDSELLPWEALKVCALRIGAARNNPRIVGKPLPDQVRVGRHPGAIRLASAARHLDRASLASSAVRKQFL